MELRYCDGCGNPIRVEAAQPFSITERCLCEPCRSGGKGGPAVAKPAADAASGLLDPSSLNLFSTQTIVIHKQKHASAAAAAAAASATDKPKSTRLKLVKPDSARVASAPVPPPGSASPAATAQKIVFRCIHCRETLSIRPVERTSKLTCPHCTKDIYITISGRALKMSPSVRVLKEGGGETAPEATGAPAATGPGSVRVVAARPGSVRVPAAAPASVQVRQPAPSPAPGARGSAVVVKPGSVRVVKSASSRVVKAPASAPPAAPPTPIPGASPAREPGRAPSVRIASPAVKPAAAPASPPGSTQIRSGSIRTLKSELSTSAPKPFSAFEEHQARQDPEKTVFITEEATADLSALATADALKDAGREVAPRGRKSVRIGANNEQPLEADRNDLLENNGGAATGKGASTGGPRQGIAQRVLKTLFTP